MLDGRNGIMWCGCALTMMLTACGGSGDVGSVISDDGPRVVAPVPDHEQQPAPGPATDEPTPQTPAEPPTSPDDTAALGTCEGPTPPTRCEADPETFDAYGRAGVISSLQLLADASCCVDYTDDERPDNALGEGFAAIDKLDALNAELHASLVSGAQTILFEAEGLDDPENDEHFALLVYGAQRSEAAESDAVELDPSTIDRGVAPLFTFDEARVQDGRLVAMQGELELEASFNGVLLKPVIHDVQVRAELDATSDGLLLRNGEIGGRVELAQLYGEMNAVAAGCDCLGLDGPLVRAADGEAACAAPDTAACAAAEREVCTGLVEVCPVLGLIAANIADIDADNDGTNESISLGALFETQPVRITGVAR